MLRVVIDPGVLVSAVISAEGPPARVLDRWREGEFDLVVSPLLLAELERVLHRPKFRAWASEAEARAYALALEKEGVLCDDPPVEAGATRDPGDDYLVALAHSARTDAIVSGDAHLTELELDPPVLTPREFLGWLDRPT